MNEKYRKLKENYLSVACKPIQKDKKLYKRIYNELSEHMDDMYDDFVSNGIDESYVPEKVIEEMGNAEELGKELYNANKKRYLITTTIAFLVRTAIILFCVICAPPILDELVDYIQYFDIKSVEAALKEEYGEITFMGEYESNGKNYRLYAPVNQPEDRYEVYSAESAEFFGKNLPDKYHSFGCDFSGSPHIACMFINVGDCYLCENAHFEVFLAPSNAKYVSFTYEACNGCNPYTTDKNEITSEIFEIKDAPCVIEVESIQGYSMYKYNYFDENLNPINLTFDKQYEKASVASGSSTHIVMWLYSDTLRWWWYGNEKI